MKDQMLLDGAVQKITIFMAFAMVLSDEAGKEIVGRAFRRMEGILPDSTEILTKTLEDFNLACGKEDEGTGSTNQDGR